MAYLTEFSGELKFKNRLTTVQLAKVKSFMGEDCREHPEWNAQGMTYIDLKLLDDFSGIKWDGLEGTHDLVKKINLITNEMRTIWPEFELTGEMFARGQEIEDVWILKMNNGIAERKEVITSCKKVVCPHCGTEFILGD